MRADPVRYTVRLLAVLLAVLLGAAGCTPSQPPPTTSTASPTPTPTPTPRDFTIGDSSPIRTADPALATGEADTLVGNAVYQRLMMVLPTGELRPDAATDCLFSAEAVYLCTLQEGLAFSNGDALTSSDVKFSLQRALRLDGPGTSVPLLGSLKRIDTPDERTVRFVLNRADNQFGYALAGLAASIVDEDTFDPDAELPLATPPIGSGPYAVEEIGADGVTFVRNSAYTGVLLGLIDRIRLAHLADSVAAEAAIADGSIDMVWRTLDDAALQRLNNEISANPDKTTATGFTRWPLPGARVTRLAWSPDSARWENATLRKGVALALQRDRTLRSLVPVGVAGTVDAFAAGGNPELPRIKGKRTILTLGYTPSDPGQGDLASLLRGRIEALDNVSVRLVTEGAADLWLTDDQPWVSNAIGWLQGYTDAPLPESEAVLATLGGKVRSTSGEQRQTALAALQQQAALDNTVLPVSQDDGILMVGPGVELVGTVPFGSGGQLGLWGIYHG